MRFDNHIAYIDADAKGNSSFFRIGGGKLPDASLKLHCGANRFDRAWKLCQEPIAGVLHDPASVFGDGRRDPFGKETCQFRVGCFFVMVH
ncbi:hypothetical protein BDS110ZK25_43970 [Bradyrhizobium diazoefficiens]|uniref:Uncharacterized protein n=1 Tax=Bradyrhizobium diazoefficiens TaxID=1355477 RepID=A0A809ZKH0_9BRAD|nr:hypothetical protein F07S3_84810 [Bradyrhizobium diazoefficiens]BCA07670.1 hypothetical protein H12S4_85740 [Bradyrhizobium diazoefficiens]BCA16337.1 hypothetical protein BDHF08_81840 [Bradyrhizobium diazoefficiens]BCA25024.1 hypothetical protein BDHH15_82390 [Bradyrhizobium diazoefficiens]BCE25759.1 hypothetical protein XF1B_84400 [Bradyrhizobium diazoefficiens]